MKQILLVLLNNDFESDLFVTQICNLNSSNVAESFPLLVVATCYRPQKTRHTFSTLAWRW